MSEEIEAYCVIGEKGKRSVTFDKAWAESTGGTVVRLSGKMPRQPIERKTFTFVEWGKQDIHSSSIFDRVGIENVSWFRNGKCQTKVEIIVRELSDE